MIIRLKGGPGNQLFQYAFGRFLSIKNGVGIKYKFLVNEKDSKREYFLGYFNTKVEIATDEEFEKIRFPFGIISKFSEIIKTKILRQFNIGYKPKLLNKKEGYLEGYWQSYKYLEPIRKELLEEITLKNPIDSKKYNILNKIKKTNSICVNVRRGDYVSNKKNVVEYVTFGMEYYENAFKLIKEKVKSPTLFVFSDDIKWCKNNLKTDIPMVFSDPNIPDYENFIIAIKCKHNIITNSSFAFWIAWLNQNPNKVVIAPKKWNNRYTKHYKDLLPPTWIQI
ncbi:MAG: alpha-1,2-fucosyltransferase [bacterium]